MISHLLLQKFTALITAISITDGVARVKEGDTFFPDIDGFLREALECLCG